jgi:hypothetical protein
MRIAYVMLSITLTGESVSLSRACACWLDRRGLYPTRREPCGRVQVKLAEDKRSGARVAVKIVEKPPLVGEERRWKVQLRSQFCLTSKL